MAQYFWRGPPISSASADPWAALDGRAGAVPGTAQYPSLLNGYGGVGARRLWPNTIVNQPPWHVAGVDYAVGTRLPVGSMVNPSTIVNGTTITSFGSGVSQGIEVSGNNITISNVDFSQNGGWQLSVDGNNCSVQDCNFNLGTNNGAWMISVGGDNFLLQYNNIDGGSQTSGAENALTRFNTPNGTMTTMYNWYKNFGEQIHDGTVAQGVNTTLICKYNLMDTGGYSTPAGAHLNYNQFGGIGSGTRITWDFNTVFQNLYGGGEGPQFYPNSTPTVAGASGTCQNNTFIAPSTAAPYGGNTTVINIIIHGGELNFPIIYNQNYFDATGTGAGGGGGAASGSGYFYQLPGNSASTWTNNIDMPTGKTANSDNSLT